MNLWAAHESLIGAAVGYGTVSACTLEGVTSQLSDAASISAGADREVALLVLGMLCSRIRRRS